MILAPVLYFLHLVTPSHASHRCGTNKNVALPSTFRLVQTCAKSNVRVIQSTNRSTPLHCAHFALEQKGLAFNFNVRDSSCFVLQCPEFDDMSSLHGASNYDYYSQYTDPFPSVNHSCVPGLGMFQLHQDYRNFADAQRRCRSEGGAMAKVHSESRTSALSSLIASQRMSVRFTRAYVGMDDRHTEGKFVITSTGEPLSCLEYRSWAPGEPRDREDDEDCVVLSTKRQWVVISCSRHMPYICELLPSDNCANIQHSDMKQNCIKNSFPTIKRRGENRFQRCGKTILKKPQHLPPFYAWVVSYMLNTHRKNNH